MTLTRHDSRKELEALRLPAAVLAIFDGQLPHESLSHHCQEPFYIFSTPVEPGRVHITPLWESGIVITAYQHSKPRGRFIKFSLEDPESLTVFGSSFQTVTAALLIDLWESETPDEKLRTIAEWLKFRHLDRLLSECESQSDSPSYEARQAWRTSFLQSCDDDP